MQDVNLGLSMNIRQLELFAALLSGWKMYSCSCSVGLGEKHLFFFVSFFFLIEKCLLFTSAT